MTTPTATQPPTSTQPHISTPSPTTVELVEHGVVDRLDNDSKATVQIHVLEAPSDKTTTEEIARKLKKPTISTGVIILILLNIMMFFAGVTTTKKCPIQPMIPIYLAVAGAGGILVKIIPIVNRNRRQVVLDQITYVLLVFETIWMVVGSYWIYSIYKPNYNPDFGPYCDKTAYLIAFWLLTIHYVCLALLLLIPFLIAVCFCCFAIVAASEL